MARWIWLLLCLYGFVMALARVLHLRELSFEEAIVARDFSNVFIAGKMIWNEGVSAIYDVAAYAEQSWRWIGTHWGNKYSYPPHSLFLVAPFGLTAYLPAILIWNIGSLVLFTLAARPYLPKSLPWWAVTFSPAALTCLVFGHYGLLMGALWLWAFRGSGVSTALLTIKPHLGIMIFVRALMERRMLVVAIVATLALVGASALVFGPELWRAYVTNAFAYQSEIVTARRPSKDLITAWSAFGPLVHLAFAIAAIWLVSRRFDVFTACTATFLIVPYAMHYDMTAFSLGIAALLAVGWQRLTMIERLLLVLAFLLPVLVRATNMIAPPLLLVALYLQVKHGALLDQYLPKGAHARHFKR